MRRQLIFMHMYLHTLFLDNVQTQSCHPQTKYSRYTW